MPGKRDVAIAGADLVGFDAPVVGQLDHGAVRFVLVADEGEGELAFGVVVAAQQAHAEDFGIEGQRLVEVADAQHGVQESHGVFLQRIGSEVARCLSSPRAACQSG